MSQDSFVQVAPDSTGKQVDMSLVQTAIGSVQRQRAEIVGDPADALNTLNENIRRLLAVQRALLAFLSNGEVTEEQFLDL